MSARFGYGLIGVALLIGIGWFSVLSRVPTDYMTGTARFGIDFYRLQSTAPYGSPWVSDGEATYTAVLRVDARDVVEWLDRAFGFGDWETRWQAGDNHQYLVERRDGEGKRVINLPLVLLPPEFTPPFSTLLTALFSMIAAGAILWRQPSLAVNLPLILLACGTLLGVNWDTFAVPFSYIALKTPFLLQLALHILSSTLLIGAIVHLALTFPTPLPHSRFTLGLIYGFYLAGLAAVFLIQPTFAARLETGMRWQQQAAVIFKIVAYLVWTVQYRRASVTLRGQLHWVLMATAAYDLVSLVVFVSGSAALLNVQRWLGWLIPAGYMLAILPGRYLRLSLRSTSGFVQGAANTLTLALFLSGFGLATNLLSNQPETLPIVTILLSILFALTTAPLATLLREQFDSWFGGTRSAQRALLHEFTGKVGEHLVLGDVLKVFHEALDQGVQPAFATLWLWNDEAQALIPTDDVIIVIPLTQPQIDQFLKTSAFTLIESPPPLIELSGYYGYVALIASGKLVGVCAIGQRIDGHNYSADTLRFFETLTRSATLAFRNAQLLSQLEDKIRALQGAYQQLITVQENERQRLAAELHDETLQQLAHISLLMGGLQQTSPELQRNITATERRLREILRGIHPAILTDLGLIPALQSWMPRSPALKIEFTAAGFENRRLPDETLELTLYRLIQESVQNVLKHAHATRVEIRLHWHENTVTLKVIDNGVGFSQVTRLAQGHFGLINLRERVNALNGLLTIASSPGQGTTIHAQLPVDEKNNDGSDHNFYR